MSLIAGVFFIRILTLSHCSVTKEKEKRPRYNKLLTYAFIVDNEDKDISEFAIKVLDSLESCSQDVAT